MPDCACFAVQRSGHIYRFEYPAGRPMTVAVGAQPSANVFLYLPRRVIISLPLNDAPASTMVLDNTYAPSVLRVTYVTLIHMLYNRAIPL